MTNDTPSAKRETPSHGLDDEVLVRVDRVSKIFCRDFKKSLFYGLTDSARDLVSGSKQNERNTANRERPLRAGEFCAVNDVSFELRRGECLGLIGRNGAGKTTLLKMLNGLIKPDKGRIEMHGRVGALIALGAGFNPLLTGRENIYVNASVLGLTKAEIEDKIDEIIDFAEIDDFIDAPVQSYSSGMQVRLGFAVATALDPDVLLLDEVLAVGDAAFRHKCYHRINKLLSQSAVILVSHSMDYIAQICQATAVMKQGKMRLFHDVNEGISTYNYENIDASTPESDGGKVVAIYPPIQEATVRLPESIRYRQSLDVKIEITSTETVHDVIFSFSVFNQGEQNVMMWNTSRRPGTLDLHPGNQLLSFKIDPLLLHDGIYRWNFSASRRGSIDHCIWMLRAGSFQVESGFRPLGNIPYIADSSSLELRPIR